MPPQELPTHVKEDLSGRYGERERAPSVKKPEPVAREVPEASKTDEEETTLERIWQPLFDAEGKATARAGQFLRGLALHLVSICM